MAFRVLVAMNDSEMAENALEFALETYPDAEVTVLSVVGAPSWFMGEVTDLALADDLTESTERRAEGVLDRARELAAAHDVEIETVVGLGAPSRAIVDRAEGFDQVVIGSHGRDLASRLLLGNVAETVVRRSPVPVTVVR